MYCDKRITKMDGISLKSSNTSKNTFKCPIEGCQNISPFNTQSLLSRHFKSAHSSVKFGCYKCERKFTDQAILFVHLSLNHSVEIPDKKQILLFDGSKDEPIGFLEVEERLEFVDEANGLLTNSDLGIFQSDLAHHIQVIDSAQMDTSEDIASIDTPLNFSTNQITLQKIYTMSHDTLETAVHEEKMPKKEKVDLEDILITPSDSYTKEELKNEYSEEIKEEPQSQDNVDVTEDSGEDNEQKDIEYDEDFVVKSRRFKKKSDMITVQMPRNVFMSPELISSLDRCKTSDNGVMRMFSKVFKQFYTVDGKRLKLDELVLSRSSIRNNRIELRNVIADQEKEKFQLTMPLRLSFGWDGKMIQDMENTKHEMQSMVVNGAPGYTEGKILDVLELTDEDGNPTSTGLAQTEANIITIREWGMADKIVAFNFDTTASNTGIWSGSAIRLNQFLNRPILYLACRHHVFELLAKNTFHKVVGYDPSPEVSMFKRMKEVFPHINTSGPFQTFDDVDNKEELIELFTNILTKRNGDGELFVRKDYRELCKLALVMLGGELPGGEVIRFVAPGAIHKARFLAFCLCPLPSTQPLPSAIRSPLSHATCPVWPGVVLPSLCPRHLCCFGSCVSVFLFRNIFIFCRKLTLLNLGLKDWLHCMTERGPL